MMRLLVPLAIVAAPLLQFRTSVDVVRVEALVLDDGRPVGGLTAADFVVTDNGVAQTIRVRALAREPIDVAVALDVSGSVAGDRLERLRAGALALVGALTPADRATLLTFDHALSLGPRDAAPAALDRRLRELSAQGRTSLVDAATTALVWSIGRDRPMLVIVFSDGRDTASWTRPEQALALAGRSGAVVDAVVTGELLPVGLARLVATDPLTPDERFVADLAASTGGRVRNGSAGAGLAGAFREALQQFRARYEISYDATSQTPGWHALDVRVPGRRGATVHVRRGYQR
jgi:Ca-activated chloride channel family protein